MVGDLFHVRKSVTDIEEQSSLSFTPSFPPSLKSDVRRGRTPPPSPVVLQLLTFGSLRLEFSVECVYFKLPLSRDLFSFFLFLVLQSGNGKKANKIRLDGLHSIDTSFPFSSAGIRSGGSAVGGPGLQGD